MEPVPLPTPAQTVTVGSLLVPLFRVSGLVVSIGIVFCVDALTRAFFGTASGVVGWIPFANRVLQAPLHRIEQKVSSFLGGLESHIDSSMGGYIHALADAVGRLASGEAEQGWAAWMIAKALHLARATIHALPTPGHVVHSTVTVTKQLRPIIQKIYVTGKVAAAAAPGYLVRQVGAIAGQLDDVITWDIPRLRARVRHAENEIGRLWKWARRHPAAIGKAAATALVTAALARIGASWIKCSNWRRIGKAGCGLNPNLLESLLADAVLVASPISVVELAKACQKFTVEAEDGIRWFVRELK